MSSVRGHALGATYAASKAFTTSLGEGLWAELQPRGVDVRVCCAGAITTPNFVGSSPSATRHHAMPQSPEAVVDVALRIGVPARCAETTRKLATEHWLTRLNRAQAARVGGLNLDRLGFG